jgi:hypothetical protein
MWSQRQGLVALALAVCWFMQPALLMAWLPGILLIATPLVRRLDGASLMVHVVGVSLAYWIAAFWFLPFFSVSLTWAFRVTTAVAIVGLAGLSLHLAPRIRLQPGAMMATLGVVAAVLALRAVPLGIAIAPAGADMSMHTYIAELILRADGVPGSYRPILEIDSFGTFPVGFHSLSAQIALLSDLPSFRASFIATACAHAFLTFTLFALLRAHASAVPAWVGAIVFSFLVKTPQGMISWGGNPTVLAIAFAALFASTLRSFRHWDAWYVLLAASSLVAVLLTHTIVFVQTAYLLGVPFGLGLLLGRPFEWRRFRPALGLALAAAALGAPYLIAIDPGVATPETREWIRHWVREPDHAWHGSLGDALWTIPRYVQNQFGDRVLAYLPFAAIGAAELWKRERLTLFVYGGFCVTGFALVLNCQYWLLPLSFLVYPERAAAMFVIPLALFFALGLERVPTVLAWLRDHGPGGATAVTVGTAVVALALGLVVVTGSRRYYCDRYVRKTFEKTPVTQADLAAIRWIAARSRPDDVIVTNHGDAGAWIPAIAFRAVTETHVNIAHLYKSILQADGRFAFVGAKCVYACRRTAESLTDEPGWNLVYRSGGAHVFEAARGSGSRE